MASKSQINRFVKYFSPAAAESAYVIGIPAPIILAQYGMETGWGTQPNMGKDNPGNIMKADGTPMPYDSLHQFAQDYETDMMNDFPSFHGQPYAASWSGAQPTLAQVDAIYNGKNSYSPADTNYGDKVYGALKTMESSTGESFQQINTDAIKATPEPGAFTPGNAATNAVNNAISGVKNSVFSWFDNPRNYINPLVVIVGVLLIALLLYRIFTT